MPEIMNPETDGVSNHVATIVAAYLQRNQVTADQLPVLITSVHSALSGLGVASTLPAEPLHPAVPIRKSITPDYLICLEDGKKLKMLRRHLRSTYNLSPDEYRAKWGLSREYPMVAPNYSESRSNLAKQLGLGLRPRQPAPPAAKPAAKQPARRGRKPKAASAAA